MRRNVDFGVINKLYIQYYAIGCGDFMIEIEKKETKIELNTKDM